jgi:hypothetical protein
MLSGRSAFASRLGLASSNRKNIGSAAPWFLGDPRGYNIAKPPCTGNRVSLPSRSCCKALSQVRISYCSLLFYVIVGKALMAMSLVGFSGEMARFSVKMVQRGKCRTGRRSARRHDCPRPLCRSSSGGARKKMWRRVETLAQLDMSSGPKVVKI